MKKLIFIVIAFLSTITTVSYCQNELTYSDVVKVDSVSKEELYNRAIEWFATSYNNSKAVLQLENRTEGQIIGKATMPYNPTVFMASARTIGVINYTIKIFIKDGRYKYEITNFSHVPTGNSSYGGLSFGIITSDIASPIQQKGQFKDWNDKVWNDIKKQISVYIAPLIENLRKRMQIKSQIKEDNW